MKAVLAVALAAFMGVLIDGPAAAQQKNTMPRKSCLQFCTDRVGPAHRNSYSLCMSKCTSNRAANRAARSAASAKP